MAPARFAVGAALQPFAFSRFHDLMHGIARVALACLLLPSASPA
ncbi:hypothetical protein [Burkholderia sp. ABCPW 11]|nr:hypothetical protein [Burkholderia sp. ABCPW 11]